MAFFDIRGACGAAAHMDLASPNQGDLRDAERDAAPAVLPALHIEYRYADAVPLLREPDVLAVVGFGKSNASIDHPAYVHVALEPLTGTAPFEVWRTLGVVRRERCGEVRCSSDDDYTFAALEVDEAAHGGIEGAAQHAYAALAAWCRGSGRHVLRIWNYLDAINTGGGDDERYRRFCSGRARGMDGLFANGYPAATAIGRRDGRRVLQLYWLAARIPGVPLENPRQLSAWRYPRRYGPVAPNFARAMRSPVENTQIYISGTAAIVGHASHHAGDCMAQLDETLENLHSLIIRHGDARGFAAHSTLKAYVRHEQDALRVAARLLERVGTTPLVILQGDICRAELLVEIDGVHA